MDDIKRYMGHGVQFYWMTSMIYGISWDDIWEISPAMDDLDDVWDAMFIEIDIIDGIWEILS